MYCEHKFVYRGLEAHGEERHSTSVPWMTLRTGYGA